MSLKEYARKRDFRKTAEPKARRTRGGTTHRFVIQKHDASRLHYDFRLELDGTLKSWAVPKGPPYRKGERRLAVQVEDHPVDYIDFEGTIPQGQYGGGTVMVWDQGTFEPLSDDPVAELAEGKLHVVLHGTKLEGEWYLVQLRGGKDWLLIKGGKDMKPVSAKADDTSAVSRRSMAAIAKGNNVWGAAKRDEAAASPEPASKRSPSRNRSRSRQAAGRGRALAVPAAATKRARGAGVRRAQRVAFVEPMKALLVENPPHGEWVYEIKLDGFRALALRDADGTRLLSRNNKDLAGRFPEIAAACDGLACDSAVLDGEIVALDERGRSSFQLLQGFDLGSARPPVLYYAFDLLSLNGRDLQALPLRERRAELEALLGGGKGPLRFSAALGSDPEPLLAQARKLGLEGLIGKRADSPYEAGQRSGAWIKLKLHHEQEFVIGGYTPPGGSRRYFGALLVGVYEGAELKFCGKVGTGFDTKLLAELHGRFERIAATECPFVNLPDRRTGARSQGVTAAEMRRCHWVEPVLVGQVKFAEWTRDDRLRQPVFLGLREDKAAREVVREQK